MNVLKNWLPLVVFALVSTTMTAQTKFGHLNSGNLLEMLPEVKTANDGLKLFGDKLSLRRDSMALAFQEQVLAYQTAAQGGTLTGIQQQTKEAELQKMQESGQQFETVIQQLVQAKREELLKPILDKVDIAIKAVGKEGGYLYIFDTSTGATLYALETEDVLPKVKAKLGL